MSNSGAMLTLAGLPTARGLASGPVFLYRGDGDVPVPEYVVPFGQESAELARLNRAREQVRRDLESLVAVLKDRTGRSDVMVFECHLMILDDPTFVADADRLVMNGHVNAESACRRVSSAARAKFERMNDPYFRERVRDLDDVERRLLKALTGFAQNPHLDIKTPSVVVADDLSPSETVQLPHDLVLGFATNGGSTTSHVALLARAMGIPAVTGLGDITARVKPGEHVLLDGSTGAVTLNPNATTLAAFEALVRRQRATASQTDSATPTGTLADGSRVHLFANIHPGAPLEGLRELGAGGIGLYRSEYLWLNRELEPTEEEQFAAYREAAAFGAQLDDTEPTVTIRALDIGGDKTVRGITVHEANPFLGNRSIRYLLSHPDIFRTQLRAILRASAFGRICLMYPMVSCVEELREAAVIFAEVRRQLDDAGVAYDRNLPVGTMIEVPAAAINAEALAEYVDFFSIGTNDLVQYTMCADRGNESVAHLYQPTHPAVLYLIRRTLAAAKKKNIPVGVCGESASDPILGVLWLAMGCDMLSMSATYIPALANILRRLTRADLDAYAAAVAALGDGLTGEETYAACRDWLAARVPDLADLLI